MDNVEKYVNYVTEVIEKYSQTSKLICNNEVNPSDLNRALASYMQTNLILLAEYQRTKIEELQIVHSYEQWYDERFMEARDKLNSEAKGSTKPALKEYETYIKVTYKDAYYDWQQKVNEAEYKKDFILRIVDLYKKQDQVLVTIANNMRQEMRTLSLENRMNADPEQVSKRKIRGSEGFVDK